jgi:cell division protein FtsB
MNPSRSSFIYRLIHWRFLVFVNIFVIIFLGIAFGREAVRSRAIDADIHNLQNRIDTLSTRNYEIAELQNALGTESFIEREARLKLGLKKPGESVVVIHDDLATQDGSTYGSDPNDPLDLVIDEGALPVSFANPTKWWCYFFDKQSYKKISDL